MKRVWKVLLLVSVCIFLAASCKDSTDNAKFKNNSEKIRSITYSNLVDEQTREFVMDSLKARGIRQKKIESFLRDVNLFNETAGEDVGLVQEGFKTIDSLIADYDVIKLSGKFDVDSERVLLHNCRLSTFRLLGGSIKIKHPIVEDSLPLFQDKDTISKDADLVEGKEDHFLSLFSYIKTKNTKDVDEHVKVLKKNWKKKGIEFNNKDIHLISVVFNSNIENKEDTSELFIGHAGLLWEEKDSLYFLEKLSFIEPYQLLKFKNRQELSDYLMNKYDLDIGQTIAVPFVMEDGELIEGYRPNMDKELR